MLSVLGRNNPAARLHHSDCEHIPLEDASLDAVLVADAWHWFEPEPAVREIRRVLKPGGWLGLVWNVVAEPVKPWELAIADDSEVYDRQSKATVAGLNRRLSYFDDADLEFKQFGWEWHLTPDHRASLLATTSMAIAMPPEERVGAVERSRIVLQQVCEAHGEQSMPLRYIASCVRWTPKALIRDIGFSVG